MRKTILFICLITSFHSASAQNISIPFIEAGHGIPVFQQRNLPTGTVKKGHAENAQKFGYRIPSLLVTQSEKILAFVERRLGLHDHAQNDLVLKQSLDNGHSWGPEIIVHEDGMHSINDPLTVQLHDGRIMVMFARFPYGRHARNEGWIKMAELGYDDPELNVLTFIKYSNDDGLTWSEPIDISKMVKPAHWINANSPGAMIQITKGEYKGRIICGLWGAVPDTTGGGSRTFEIISAWSDDMGTTWHASKPLEDPESGFPNECQIAEASDGSLVLISRNQSGETFRKKAFSNDGGESWTTLHTDTSLASVACMGSLIRGAEAENWDLYASFPSNTGRENGQIAKSQDLGKSFKVKKIIKGGFAYSATQISRDGKNLLILYETDGYQNIRFLSIPIDELK